MIVLVDILMMFMISIFIIKLRWYERMSVNDIKQGKTSIEDFAVTIPDIPIDRKDYHNNPDLLTAMLVCHLEDICFSELQ